MKLLSRRAVLARGIGFFAAALPPAAGAQTVEKPDWRVQLVEAARRQIGVTTLYDPAYVRMPYPDGDVPPERGVCTDVVIRAYRAAFGLDLQRLVHEDMMANFAAYPKSWGMKGLDANIDHRRVYNLATFFRRKGAALPVSEVFADYQPGDLVTQMLAANLPHIVIVSSARSVATPGRPLVIQNIGQGTKEDDTLFGFQRTGHYRFAPV